LQYLLESVAARSDVEAIAVVDRRGEILAGKGAPKPLRDLARLTREGKSESPNFAKLTEGTDFFGCDVGETSLVAFGTRIPRLPEAVRSVRRILGS
jgi:hypothetical protein